MKKFLNTATGSYLKVFTATILSLVLVNVTAGKDLFSINYKEILSGAIVSFLPIIINWLNPNDPRYGNKDQNTLQ